MIKEFNIKNFKSFKNEARFTMEADLQNVSEHKNHYVEFKDNNSILKVASIYGPNASGKSNLLQGFNYLKFILSHGTKYMEEDAINENFRRVASYKFENFILTNDENNIISFEIITINDKFEIEYKVSIEKNEFNSIIIADEVMDYRSLDNEEFENLFERNKEQVKINSNFNEVFNSFPKTISNQTSVVKIIDQLYISSSMENEGLLKVVEIFINEISGIRIISPKNFNRPLTSLEISRFMDDRYKKLIIKILNSMNIRISDIFVLEQESSRPRIVLERTSKDGKHQIPFEEESDGTIKLFKLIPRILNIISQGGVLIIDEIDAHFHPKLTKEIISIFTSELNIKAQLVFTSHDILNMNKDNFRRDEIWFVAKEDEFESELFALTDIVNYKGEKVRKDAKYSKQYLEGRYGADPFINAGVFWDDE